MTMMMMDDEKCFLFPSQHVSFSFWSSILPLGRDDHVLGKLQL